MSAKKWLCKSCADGCYLAGTDRQISFCLSYKPQTNADRVRAMSDEELAAFLANIEPAHCRLCPADKLCTGCVENIGCAGFIERWLRQPVKDGDTDV